ncbi:hypothetical protein [Morganella morganii]|uniref:hypothetical protein n=1 Tax=Morganella morganii TaxID=582 RepID=UPI00345BA4E7
MTVSTELSHEEYTGNGVTTDFDFRFRIFEAKHLVVSIADTNGTERILTNGTDYTLRGVGSYRGGKVILKMPLATGWKIGIARDLPAVQETDLRNQGKFFAEVHEDAFDYLTMLIQKSLGFLSLCLRKPSFISDHYDAKGNKISNLGKPVKDDNAVDLGTMKDHISAKDKHSLRVADKDIPVLPNTANRANKLLSFDNEGNPKLVLPESGSAADVLLELAKPDGAGLIGFKHNNVYAKLNEFLTIADFGAVTVSGTDNTPFINLMLDERDVVIPAGIFEIRTDITFNRNVIFLPNSTLKLIGDITLTFERDIVAPNCQIFDLSLGGHIVVAGDYDAPGVTEINPYWFAHDDTGWSQIIRGRNAGTKAIHNRSKINYSHIDGFRACEKTENAIEHTAIGCFAGAALTDSYLSTAVGYGALRGKEDPSGSGVFRGTKASETTAVGQGALQDGIDHQSSTAVGSGAGNGVLRSLNATIVGTNAARLSSEISNVVAIGTGAAYTWGVNGENNNNNVVIGTNACFNNKIGHQNTIVGSIAGAYAVSCHYNTWIGHQTGGVGDSGNNTESTICIGDSARTTANHTITIGNNIINSSAGRIIIGNDITTDCQIRGIYNTTTASGSNVYVDTLGFLFRSTSSKKYKKDIEPYDLEWAYKVLEFEPVVYKPTENAANPDWTYYGYIAEQVAKVDPRYTHMEINDGVSSPSGVMYERIVVAQGMIIKDLLDRVDALERNKK